ncbi:MAG: 3'(2'),5'-bisphosphate nucleotidase [Flavobacteriales bacterium]|nr:3'(2'),5'-bisphosphate nucleotidase [Flavobacteriales bacterium]
MPTFSLHRENLNNLIEISLDAGKAIMDIYKTDFNVKQKSDKSPLTKADMLSHTIISRSLKKLTPKIPVLSEESINIPLNERLEWKDYWLVDPLDGTKEFINRNDEFTTNIALIRDNRPVYGIIYAPALDETYWGSVTNGSFTLKGDNLSDAKRIRVNDKSRSCLRIIKSRSHPSNELNNFLNRLDRHQLVEKGSSLKFCLVANGDADCYPRFGPTSEWDTAAGEAIVLGAGGRVINLKNQLIKYNKGDSLINPSFIALNNQLDLNKILAYV